MDPAHFELLSDLDRDDLPLGQLPIVLALGKSPSLKLVRATVVPKDVFIKTQRNWFARQLDFMNGSQSECKNLLKKYLEPWYSKGQTQNSDSAKAINVPFEVPSIFAIKFLEAWPLSEQDKQHFQNGIQLLKQGQPSEIKIVLMGRPHSDPTSISSRGEYRTIAKTVVQTSGDNWQRIKQLPSSNDLKANSSSLPTIQIHFLDVVKDNNLEKNRSDAEARELLIKDAIGITLAFPDIEAFGTTLNGENFVFRKALTN